MNPNTWTAIGLQLELWLWLPLVILAALALLAAAVMLWWLLTWLPTALWVDMPSDLEEHPNLRYLPEMRFARRRRQLTPREQADAAAWSRVNERSQGRAKPLLITLLAALSLAAAASLPTAAGAEPERWQGPGTAVLELIGQELGSGPLTLTAPYFANQPPRYAGPLAQWSIETLQVEQTGWYVLEGADFACRGNTGDISPRLQQGYSQFFYSPGRVEMLIFQGDTVRCTVVAGGGA